jgi:hypothetical protein
VYAGVRRPQDGDALRSVASDRLTPIVIDVTDAESIGAARDRVAEQEAGVIEPGFIASSMPGKLQRDTDVWLQRLPGEGRDTYYTAVSTKG